MSENVYTQMTTTAENYLLEENSLYTTNSGPQIQVLQTMVAGSTLMELSAKGGNLNDITFDVSLNQENFVGNGMVLRVNIPLSMTMTNPPPLVTGDDGVEREMVITADNYVNGIFNNYVDLALKQYGLLNMLDSASVQMNSNVVSSVVRIAEQASIIFPYYSESQVDDFFEASLPDRFQKYED